MSGEGIHYSLRPNKFVERQMFVELVDIVNAGTPPSEQIYISMGGPQLEDHRLIHCRLGLKNLISLEANSIAYNRQLFNCRPAYIECRNCTTGDFNRDFDEFADEHADQSFIIWLDYTSPHERLEQLLEYQSLLGKLNNGDILKITMNANTYPLGRPNERKDNLTKQLDGYLPPTLPDRIDNDNFPGILCHAIRKASIDALSNKKDLYPIPIAILLYADGPHPMLTITVRLTLAAEREVFCTDLLKSGWEYLPSNWFNITKINVPLLTTKERLLIEGLLFSDNIDKIHEQLPFKFNEDEEVSLNILTEYSRHCCRYPSFYTVQI